MDNAWLIAGLGNPGREYRDTRHNAGFMVVEALGRRWQAAWSEERRFQARMARVRWDAVPVVLCQPRTFMNESGEAVRGVADFYRVAPGRVVVVVDDADLALGWIRLRASGSSGGHHGLESVERHLATREFARLRIGIGREPGAAREITGHVLSPFRAGEREVLDRVMTRACDQLECCVRDGVAQAMNRFNGVIPEEND